jgi:hypothetical protein
MEPNRRDDDRRQVDLDVDVLLPSASNSHLHLLSGRVRNVSCTGALLRVDPVYAPYFRPSSLGTPIELLYYDPDTDAAIVAEYVIGRIIVGNAAIEIACDGRHQKEPDIMPFVDCAEGNSP